MLSRDVNKVMLGAPISIGLGLNCCRTGPKSARAKPIEIGAPTLSTARQAPPNPREKRLKAAHGCGAIVT